MADSENPERGCWLLKTNGQIVELPVDPETEMWHEPGTLPEVAPGERTPILNPDEAYRRFILRDGPKTVAVYYARREPSADEKLRLLNAAYGSYGRD